MSFNKKLDYQEKKYLLNPTGFSNSNVGGDKNLPFVVSFFENNLGSNVIKTRSYKDSLGKLKIPFYLDYDISDEQVLFLKENTDLNYLILSKISFLEDFQNGGLTRANRKLLIGSEAGAISFIKILDIQKNEVFLEINCVGTIRLIEERDFYTNETKLQPTTFHKDSYELGEKAMKKLLRKIK
ncbi:hypothetical protein [Polaribacter sp. IC063]|uniref:hypothetical protein n=1 Tax=Polaribacter sp. IC063 TaxID=57031 RepID=UPI0011C311BA|nr:hypothetical protein [Polaribacter sp. IC063]TXD53065.1 hypothetical protein ES043_05900 [Polaribacter sp. IC063]